MRYSQVRGVVEDDRPHVEAETGGEDQIANAQGVKADKRNLMHDSTSIVPKSAT